VGLQLGLLLIISGVVLFAAQVLRGYEVSDYHPNKWLWIIPALAFLALEFATRYIEAAAKRQNSPALSADAKHFRVDAISSLIAALALGIGSIFTPVAVLFDHFGALLIALFMIYLGIKASRENLEQILDQTPDEEYFEFVRMAARSVKGVLGVEKVKIQRYGPDAHVDIDIEVDPKMDVESSHRITQLVTSEIKKGWPEVQDVPVHVEPYYPGDH
jgi:cation diffusion facilitator family transporter